ncbi:MAG: hypothetical protein K9J17_15515 [Flavobacteriales bacterium]|nr:hypothetical protein [Flavobacteriales bacterium]
MIKIAHIVNLFQPSETSDLKLAQEVTLASMIRARINAKEPEKIELLSAQIEGDIHMVPKEFKATSSLTRDVTNLKSFSKKMQLPILNDILDRLYNESDAEYLIFSNVDIGIQPHFYDAVNEMIDAGYDAFMINRRRIEDKFDSVDQLDDMLTEKGKSHPGFDCFVFKRELYPQFSLAEVCIGVPFIEITLSQNLFCFAENPKVFTDEYLTFHIGMEIFKGRAPKEYYLYNQVQFWQAMSEIWPNLNTRKWPYGNWWFPFRIIYWGLHPCFPIRLALKLEPRRWGILKKL